MKQKIENLFKWNVDDDGDLTLTFVGIIHVTYYKWHDTAILRFGRKNYQPAEKAIWRKIHS
jgi:hypothetical protein